MASRSANDDATSNPDRRVVSENAALKTQGKILFIATWNVRTLYQPGKLDNAIKEMTNMKIDILGIAETRWTDSGKIIKDNHTIVYSGGQEHRNGVGILMRNNIAKSLIGYWPVSDRVIMIKIQAKPFNINIIQLYAPTQDYDEDEIEEFYEEAQQAIKHVKSGEILCIMGDMNAKVGTTPHDTIVGSFGLGERNDRGDRLIQFCEQNQLMIANTWFQQPPRKLYTWKSPGDITRNQIDYIMISNRFRNCVKQAKTLPGADINSDHNPVKIHLKVKLKQLKKAKSREQLDLDLLKEYNVKSRYNVEVRNRFESLASEETPQQPEPEHIEQKWSNIKQSINQALTSSLPKRTNRKKQHWMTDDILNKMDKRKEMKGKDEQKYRQLDKEISNECNSAKIKWLNEQCENIEELEKHFRSKEMHQKIKQVTGKSKGNKGTGCIKDKNGNILFDEEKIAERWVEYIKELYNDDREPIPQFITSTGESILKGEVEHAIKLMKSGKATGPDELPAEAIKALDEHNIGTLTKICNIIYNSGYIPTEMRQSIFIPIPKKPKAQNCTEYRTISLMSHITKLLLKIIQIRISTKINQEVSELQSGFRPGMGTREGIFNLRMICERVIDLGKDLYICFIDYTKAFDRVKHSKMIECLKEIGVDDKDLQIITKLYWEQTAVVWTESGLTSEFKIKKGVRQGCVLSSSLFNLYTEKIFKEVEDMPGVNIGGMNINNLRYADDTSLLCLGPTDLQNLLHAVNEAGKPYGMEMNVIKTKTMVVSKSKATPQINITLEGRPIQQTMKMVYLGGLTTNDGKCEQEIKRRIELARTAFQNMSKVLTSRKINIQTRKRLLQCYVWSTLLYGSETWTLHKPTIKRLEAFEMWSYRRMMRISWTKHKTNEEVLRMANVKRSLITIITKRKCQYFGHLIRRNGIQRTLLEAKIEGKRGRGRPRVMWMDNIKDWTKRNYGECVWLAEDRYKWRSMTVNLL